MDGGRKEQLGQGGHLLLAVGVAGGGRREHLGQGGHLLLAGGGSKDHRVQDGHLLLAVAVGGVVGTGVEAGGLSGSNESSSLL